MSEIPEEVLKAKQAYMKAYEEIRPLIKAQKKKYLGTKFEECPPLIKEQGQFFVSKKDRDEVSIYLKEKYGEFPSTWSMWVAWYKKHKNEKSIS
jgi:hypothetical protein